MNRSLLWICFVLCIGVPALAFVGVGAMGLMPGCTGGSSGPASGCYLFGSIDLNWLVQVGIVATVCSFITVPAGVLIFGVAMAISVFTRDPGETSGKDSSEK